MPPPRQTFTQEVAGRRAARQGRQAERQREFDALMRAMEPLPSVTPQAPIAPPPEPTWGETAKKWAPTAVRGVGGFLGFTPVTGALGGAASESIAQGLEMATGAREDFSFPELAAATGVGAMGGGMIKAIAPVFKQPLQAALRAAPWAAGQPIVHSLLSEGELPEVKDVLTSTAVGAGTAGALGGLGKLLTGKLGKGGPAPGAPGKPPAPPAPNLDPPSLLVDRMGEVRRVKQVPLRPEPQLQPGAFPQKIAQDIEAKLSKTIGQQGTAGVKGFTKALDTGIRTAEKESSLNRAMRLREDVTLTRQEQAADLSYQKSGEKYQQEQARLAEIEASREAAGVVPQKPSFSTSLSAKTPTGESVSMRTPWRAPEPEGAGAAVEGLTSVADDMAPIIGKVAPTAPVAPSGGTTASVPFMITRQMDADLLGRGYSPVDIAKMAPAEAQAILAQPTAVSTFDAPALDPTRIVERRMEAPGRFEGVERRTSPVMQQIAEMDVAQGAAIRGTEADIAHMGPEAMAAEARRRAIREAWTPEAELPVAPEFEVPPIGAASTIPLADLLRSKPDIAGQHYTAIQNLFKAGGEPNVPLEATKLGARTAGQGLRRVAQEAGLPIGAAAKAPQAPLPSPESGIPPRAPSIPAAPQAGQAAPFDFGAARAKIDASKGRPGGALWNLLTGERGGGGGRGEAGFINPEVATSLAFGVGGAAAGAAVSDEENRIQGAIAGGLIGAIGGPAAIKKISTLTPIIALDPLIDDATKKAAAGFANPQAVKETIGRTFALLPEVTRFNLLSSSNLANNAIVAPLSAMYMRALESHMLGDPRGKALIAAMTPENISSYVQRAHEEAISAISMAEQRSGGVGFAGASSQFRKMLTLPGVLMTTGDKTAVNIMRDAGYTLEEATRMTLTREPEFAVTKMLANLGRSGPFGQTLLPFSKTVANIAEEAALSTPVLGSFVQGMRDVPDPLKVQLVKQALGTGVTGLGGAAGYFTEDIPAGDNPLWRKFLRSTVANAGGPYSGLAAAGYAGGQALRAGKTAPDVGYTMATEGLGNLPLPSTSIPFEYFDLVRDAAKGELDRSSVPGAMIPGMYRDLELALKPPVRPVMAGKRQPKQKKQKRS